MRSQHRRWRLDLVVVAGLVLATAILQPGLARAGRPLDTEDTATVDPGKVDLELSTTWEKAPGERSAAAQAALNVGVAPGLQLKIASGADWVDPDDARDHVGVSDTFLGAKYRLLDEAARAPAVLAAVTLRLPTGDEDRGLGQPGVDIGLLAVVSKTFGPLTLAGNGGYTCVTADRAQDVVTVAVSAEFRVTESWVVVGELFNQVPVAADEPSVVLRGGAIYALGPSIRLDGAVGVGLTRQSPDVVITVGVTIAF